MTTEGCRAEEHETGVASQIGWKRLLCPITTSSVPCTECCTAVLCRHRRAHRCTSLRISDEIRTAKASSSAGRPMILALPTGGVWSRLPCQPVAGPTFYKVHFAPWHPECPECLVSGL